LETPARRRTRWLWPAITARRTADVRELTVVSTVRNLPRWSPDGKELFYHAQDNTFTCR